MKREHLKRSAMRDHLQNPHEHDPGHWSRCRTCARVYNAVTSKLDQARDKWRVTPAELTPVTRRDTGETVYITRAHGEIVTLYHADGTPILIQRNREAEYLPVCVTIHQIEL